MTAKLKQAIERVQALPAEKQNWFANMLLEALNEANASSTQQTTVQERVAAFDAWVASHSKGVGISPEALRRVNLYD